MIDVDGRQIALQDAVQEAERFIQAANVAFEDLKTKGRLDSSKALSTAKRASMELTNALVRVRNPR